MNNKPSVLNLLLRRIAAFFYDCLLLIAVYFVITAIVVITNDGEAIQHWGYKIFLIFIAFVFFDWFWRHGGQTLGMRAWRLRIEGQEQEHVTLKQTIQHYFLGLFIFGFTYLYMFANNSQLALHDKLSKTKIIIYYK